MLIMILPLPVGDDAATASTPQSGNCELAKSRHYPIPHMLGQIGKIDK